MKAPREEEGGIIAQGSSVVNRIFASKDNNARACQGCANDSAKFPASGETSLLDEIAGILFFMNFSGWGGSMMEEIQTRPRDNLGRSKFFGGSSRPGEIFGDVWGFTCKKEKNCMVESHPT